MLHVHKRRGGEQDGLIEKQAHLATGTVGGVHNVQELLHVQERHVRVHILGVGLEERALEGAAGKRQGALLAEEADVLGGDLGGEDGDEAGQQGVGVDILEAAELRVPEERDLVQEVRQEPSGVLIRGGASEVGLGVCRGRSASTSTATQGKPRPRGT